MVSNEHETNKFSNKNTISNNIAIDAYFIYMHIQKWMSPRKLKSNKKKTF